MKEKSGRSLGVVGFSTLLGGFIGSGIGAFLHLCEWSAIVPSSWFRTPSWPEALFWGTILWWVPGTIAGAIVGIVMLGVMTNRIVRRVVVALNFAFLGLISGSVIGNGLWSIFNAYSIVYIFGVLGTIGGLAGGIVIKNLQAIRCMIAADITIVGFLIGATGSDWAKYHGTAWNDLGSIGGLILGVVIAWRYIKTQPFAPIAMPPDQPVAAAPAQKSVSVEEELAQLQTRITELQHEQQKLREKQ